MAFTRRSARQLTALPPPALGPHRRSRGPRSSRHGSRRRVLLVVLLVAGCFLGFGAVQSAKAARAAFAGKAALERAEKHIDNGRLGAASAVLADARTYFVTSRHEVRLLERYAPFSRWVPLVGTQIQGVAVLADSGALLADAGLRLTGAATSIIEPEQEQLELSDALSQLREINGLLRLGVSSLDEAAAKVDSLDGTLLVRPLGRARAELAGRLADIRRRATDAADGLRSLITFIGGDGPRTYLVLSQNPDEVRPTGGYIGTYGVLSAVGGKLSLERYDSIESWFTVHREAEATPEERAGPLRFDSRARATIANVNMGPDWTQAAQLATRLWERGGEAPVQGVVSFTPAFLGQVLSVIGPVVVETFGETISADNLVERLDYYTHLLPPAPGEDRKEFIAELAKALMPRLFAVQASRWEALAKVLGHSFGAREAMVWSADTEVASVLAARGWDGSVPARAGDFVLPAEFEYANKNGRELRRTYEHHVVVHADGSARVTTVLTLVNPEPPSRLNLQSVTYISMYGPAGAVLDPASDPLAIPEPPVSGHPGAGWVRPVTPESQTTVTVVWNVPNLVEADANGDRAYSLLWMRHPDHKGDTLKLRVELPPGWKWASAPPPAESSLDRDVVGSWAIAD